MLRELFSSLRALVLFTLVTGALYPIAVLAAGRALFPEASLGSRVVDGHGALLGSALIGQRFESPGFFHGRPSAAGEGYDASASGGSNLSPVGATLLERVRRERDRLRAQNPDQRDPVPLDLLTASGSGLDPEISPEAARWQAPRIAKARGVDPERVRSLVDELTVGRTLGFLGEPRVNVLELDLELDARWPLQH